MITSQLQKQRDTPPRRLIILDFCTGTGCISLLLLSLLSKSFPGTQIDVTGVDISETALKLARKNYERNLQHYPNRERHRVRFEKVDVLDPKSASKIELAITSLKPCEKPGEETITIVVSNPPYISKEGFEHQTERSVRNYEPELALVPKRVGGLTMDNGYSAIEWDPELKTEDIFYKAVEERAKDIGADFLLMEVAGTEQAVRVAREVMYITECPCGSPGCDGSQEWPNAEIWGDELDVKVDRVEDITAAEKADLAALNVGLTGAGMGRSVFFSGRSRRARYKPKSVLGPPPDVNLRRCYARNSD